MAKIADSYFREKPWEIVEDNFDLLHAQVAESIFSLGNEYMGVRGFMEESPTAQKLVGSYFNGIYERKQQGETGYKGIVTETEFMVNAMNWLDTRICVDDELLDVGRSSISDFKRTLNMKNGLLTRSFHWHLKDGGCMEVCLERLLSMTKVELGAQRITITPIDCNKPVLVGVGLDISGIHESAGKNFWTCNQRGSRGENLYIGAQTVNTGQLIYAELKVTGAEYRKLGNEPADKKNMVLYGVSAQRGKTYVLERIAYNGVCRRRGEAEQFYAACSSADKLLADYDFARILQENTAWWGRVWQDCDIEIWGDAANQQGIRFCIFQLFSTYHGAVEGSNIGAKGLTGEAYNGNAFWDTETYCLPFFLFNDVKSARNLLYFRYATLQEAKKRAGELDCKGAFYPVATISGQECCNLWQHASLQLQASTAVAYGIWFYEKITGDREFMEQYGLEMLLEISRMLASRGDYSADQKTYGFYGVMGPDEFQMMVNHNCYTNLMGKFTLLYTIREAGRVQQENPKAYRKLCKKIAFCDGEMTAWKKMADCMYIPYDAGRKLYEEHDGYFTLPHVEVNRIPVEDFPLYSHWSYDRIYRNDMIKQPDVLMFFLLFNSSFSEEELRSNYEYYEPRCIHESSLSPSVHSILACQLKKREEAYAFFRFATRMDLDNYNRNSHEGIHTTSIAAAWMNIVYGFGGLRSDGEQLSLCPSIPAQWEGYAFRLHVGEEVLAVRVTQQEVWVQAMGQTEISIVLYGREITAGQEPKAFAIPAEWRA